MTDTPDPGLTDLIAAHRWTCSRDEDCICGWVGPFADFPAHVASVVEQHTNGRIAEYIAQLESERETVTSMCSELESIRDEQAARIAELEALRRVDQDLFVQTLAIANQRKARAGKAEATIARVEKLAAEYARDDQEHLNTFGQHHPVAGIAHDHLRAALKGEQQ